MASILDQIVEQTQSDLRKRKNRTSFKDLESFALFGQKPRSFAEALVKVGSVSIIAEIKKASPSKGIIRPDFDPGRLALQYQKGGANAISILTDEPAFQGKLDYLEVVSSRVNIPVLRKDFIVDPYQVQEAKAYGADAILLIATITSENQLEELLLAAKEVGLQCLVECYSETDAKKINFSQVNILGINNRDLHTFEVDVHRGIALLQTAPEGTVLVSESGLNSASDLKLLLDEGIHAALIGEYFMRQENPGDAVRQILDALEPFKKDSVAE